MKHLSDFIYRKVLGWKYVVTVPDYDKSVICAAPHTSNWDFIIGKLFYSAIGRKTYFFMKSDWFFFPLGFILKKMGGIPINRKKHLSTVDQMVAKIKSSDKITIAITPEGTRAPNKDWKKGFYYIAYNSGVPIVLIGIDYEKKTIYAEKSFIPSGNVESDINEMKLYFTKYKGKRPGNYVI